MFPSLPFVTACYLFFLKRGDNKELKYFFFGWRKQIQLEPTREPNSHKLSQTFSNLSQATMCQISVGGASYEKEFYTIRVAADYAKTPSAPDIKDVKDTEAVLHKLGSLWDFERISIHIRDGRIFTEKNALRDYLLAQGVKVFFNPTTYAEVFVPSSSSYWKSWDLFQDNSKLAEGSPILIVPQSLEKPDVLPRPFDLMLATYEIRHNKNTAPGLCETRKRTGTMTFQDSGNHYIKDELGGQHYFTLAHWHLMNPFATEKDIAKDFATNGSPWSHIDVKVGDEWITGCSFLERHH